MELALARDDLMPIQHSGLLLTKARLYAYEGDIPGAVASMEKTFAVSPHEVGFLIELAEKRNLRPSGRAVVTDRRVGASVGAAA